MPEEEKLAPGSDDKLARKNSNGGNRRKQQVSENVVKKMSMKPDDGTAPPLAPADFTVHITEAGEEVRTTSRIIKGKIRICFRTRKDEIERLERQPLTNQQSILFPLHRCSCSCHRKTDR